MSGQKSILTISRNPELQNQRSLILTKAGYAVSAATTDAEAITFMESPNSFRLALLCHSVPEESRLLLVKRMKELSPKLPVLMLYNGYDQTLAHVDGALFNLETPEVWLDMISFLIEGSHRVTTGAS